MYSHPQDCFTLETDASSSGVGAVLSVKRNGENHPVAFYSKALHGAQRRYSAQELEGLAVCQAITRFSPTTCMGKNLLSSLTIAAWKE